MLLSSQVLACHARAAAMEPAPVREAVPVSAPPAPSSERANVFFSGHSLLDNPLPDWIELIAASRGDRLAWQEQIVLGSPIRVRTKGDDPEGAAFPGYQLGKGKSGGAIDVLEELAQPTELAPGEKYQRLVITERTDLLGAIQWEGTIGYLRHFHDRLVEHDAQAATLLTQVWPEIDAAAPLRWVEYVESELFVWECVAVQVNRSLEAEGRAARVEVVPAGLALSALVRRALSGGVPGVGGTPEQRVAAIFADDVHLTPLGVYLLAALHYGALFDKPPRGAAGPAEVNAAALPVLQELAWDTLSAYRPRAAQPPSPSECRARIASDLCPAYHRFRGRPERVAECAGWAEADGPLSKARPAAAELPAFVGVGASSAAFALLAVGAYGYWRYRASSR